MKCKNCGCELQPGIKFCPVCGTKAGKLCPECGAEVNEEIKFCPNCGKEIRKVSDEVVEETRMENGENRPSACKDSNAIHHAETGNLNSKMKIVGKNTKYYVGQFENLQAGRKCKINWASFFLGLFHAAYRNMWKEWLKGPGIPQIVSALVLLIGGGMLFITGNTIFMAPVMVIMVVAQIIGVVMHILFACRFNRIYLKHVDEKAERNDYNRDPSVPRAVLVTIAFGIVISICQGIYMVGSTNSIMSTTYEESGKENSELLSESKVEIENSDVENQINTIKTDFIFSDSDTRYLTEEDLQKLSEEEIQFGAMEILARHGVTFYDMGDVVQEYFNEKSWYIPVCDIDSFDETELNEFEMVNLNFLLNSLGYGSFLYSGLYVDTNEETTISISLYSSPENEFIGSIERDYGFGYEHYMIAETGGLTYDLVDSSGQKCGTLQVSPITDGKIIFEVFGDSIIYYCVDKYEDQYFGDTNIEDSYTENLYANSGEYLYVVNCKESITLREAPSTQAAELTQIPLYAAVEFIGAAENGFYQVVYNGMLGYALASYLDVYEPQVATGVTCTVVNCNESITLRTSPSTNASEICQIPLGATVYYIEPANDFYLVNYNGETGYALASYLKFN